MKTKTIHEKIQAILNAAVEVLDTAESKGVGNCPKRETGIVISAMRSTLTQIGYTLSSNFGPDDIPVNREVLEDALETLVKSQRRGFLCGEDGVLYTPSIEGLKKALGEE